MKSITIHITGKVQGVAFRYYTKKKADELSLFGTVENLTDGSVLIHAKGTDHQLKKITLWCQTGSPASNVSDIKIKMISDQRSQDFEDFSIIR